MASGGRGLCLSADKARVLLGLAYLEFMNGADDGAELSGTIPFTSGVLLSAAVDDTMGLVDRLGVGALVAPGLLFCQHQTCAEKSPRVLIHILGDCRS